MNVQVPDFNHPDLQDRIQTQLEKVEDLLLHQVQGAGELVDSLTRHLAQAGGKRMRPLLVMICGLLGDHADEESLVRAAVSVELTHLATLYHDDVMDSAPQRRGVSSAQIEWGNNRAILAGDVLFARASQITAKLGPDAVSHHAKTFERLCVGQLNETFGPADGADKVDFYLQVLADKTGSLVASAAYFGALYSGAPKAIQDAVSVYAERVGVAFQLADDILDLVSSSEVSGKTPGTDLREGVDTMPVLLLRRRAARGEGDNEDARILDALAEDLSSDAALARVVEMLVNNRVIDETRALAREAVDHALEALEPLPDSEAKDMLVHFANLTIDRVV